jgi:putative sterol carrier protein
VTHAPFTPEWTAALCAAIESDTEYRAAAANWTWPVALVLEPAPELGYPEPVAAELTLDRGRCRGAELRALDAVTAPFVLTASYATWKSIVHGGLDVISAVVQRRVTVQGSLVTLMLHTKAAIALVACARRVPTRFPDEA